MDSPDHELLQRYVHRSEEAFAALVARHIDLVYSAALRQVRGAHLAEEVAQQVFVELARHAANMKPDTLLAAWLHAVTRRRAIDVVRAETRRRQREQSSLDLAEINPASNSSPAADAEWTDVAPLLDEALQSLAAPERDAVLLRYFENKSLREVGQTLGISDDAAQKRVHRALERLRAHFVKRRIPLGAAGLATLLSTQAVQAAPAGLAATVSSAVLLSAGAGVGLAVATKTIAMTTLQKSLLTATLALSLGFGVYEARQVARMKERLASVEQTDALASRTAARRLAELTDDNTHLRAEADRLRAEALAATQTQAEDAAAAQDPELRAMADWLERVRTLKAGFKTHPDAATPEMQWLDEEDWLAAAKDNPLADHDDFRHAAALLRGAGDNIFARRIFPALRRYLDANNKAFPFSLDQLQPFLDPPIDPVIFERWTIKRTEGVRGISIPGDWAITQKQALDEEADQTNAIGEHGPASMKPDFDPAAKKLNVMAAAFVAANGGRSHRNPSDLLPYATTPAQKTVLAKLIAAQNPAGK